MQTTSAEKMITESFEAFDTVNRISLPEKHAGLMGQCLKMCARYHGLFSPTIETSDVMRINCGEGAVKAAPETLELIRRAKYMYRLTDGLFDITTARAVRLWDIKNRRGALPEAEELREAASKRGVKKLQTGEDAVVIPRELAVDLGGIAKGFIADKLTGFLRNAGVEKALIDLGGNIAVVGQKSADEPWSIGLRDPRPGAHGNFAAVICADMSVVTSSASERYFEFEGRTYHHILDPETGWPVESDIISATVIAPSSTDADALATALFAGGMTRAREILKKARTLTAGGVLLGADGNVFISRELVEAGMIKI